MSAPITGGCLCGACRYETDAAPINVRVCHCRLCQKATGAPFYARVLVPLDRVVITGPVGWHHSSPDLRRGFCLKCGTTMFSERAAANMVGLTLGSLDEPDRFPPSEQIYAASRLAWIELPGLPSHDAAPS